MTSDLPEDDIAFAKGHLLKWCEREKKMAKFDLIWEKFMKRPKWNFENKSWPEIEASL